MSDHGAQRAVLVIDDEEIILKLAKRMLEKQNFKVFHTLNGQGGETALRENIDDIVMAVVDVFLPDIHGTELARKLLDIKPDLKILFASGYGVTEDIQFFIDAGKAQFIAKPFTREDIAKCVVSLLPELS